ncbi:DUF3891 family protein [Halosimplex aquaticum]|uniref:DUF3891 family protein n=1 Tax=Halosimplex aquaticum TaxID=3026162 RepID=A0ABD5XYY9_9EURY|nr:DUF3891 family protein [Halosimplex aquaticum]
MIVAETEGGYQFVTQPDHAALAGQFADHWGTGDAGPGATRFDRPEPFAPLALAAYAHDTGWRDFDRHPRLGDDGDPIDFREMPAGPWIDLYDDGIDAVVEADDYAGLLVSMHGAGLRKRRYGLSPGWPETPDEFREFVAREERRQDRLAERLRADDARPLLTDADRDLLDSLHGSEGVPDGYDGRLWADYRRLQAWDELSLAFCVTADPPGYDEIEGVPTTGARDGAALSITPVGTDEYRVDPYPFDESPLDVSVPLRRVDGDAFSDEDSLVRAYYEAGRETRSITLTAGDQ